MQGSILGSLLFLIYTNDFKPGLSLIVSLFVDDYVIFMVITSAKDCDNLQAEQLYYWVQLWQFNLDQSKCKVMRITN